jgi:transcriptional regulator with XRE-family HTH domain
VTQQIASNPVITLDLKSVGSVLKLARENLRYSFRELASKCGVSATQLMRIESGEFEYSVAKLAQICWSLGVPVGDLIEFGTVRKFVLNQSVLWGEEDVVTALMLAEDAGIDEAEARSRVLRYVNNNFQWMLNASTSASCDDFDRCLDTAINDRDTLGGLYSGLSLESNLERILTIRAALQNPYQKLKAMGLVSLDGLTHAIEDQTLCEFTPKVPTSIKAILDAAADPAAHFPSQFTNASQAMLDKLRSQAHKPYVISASSSLGSLIMRLATVVARKRGLRSDLARELGVTRQAVDNWLRGKAAPDGDRTLKLQGWVELMEAEHKNQKPKSPGDVTSISQGKKPERKAIHANPTSRRKK